MIILKNSTKYFIKVDQLKNGPNQDKARLPTHAKYASPKRIKASLLQSHSHALSMILKFYKFGKNWY